MELRPLLAALALGCQPADKGADTRGGGPGGDDTATPDSRPGGESGPPDTAGDSGDSGQDCPEVALVAPVGVELWVGSRYDLVLSGAASASMDGAAMLCEPVDGLLICPFTPDAAGAPALAAAPTDCPERALGALSVVAPQGVYPRGDRLMVGLYSADETAAATLADLLAAGVNAVHTYAGGDDLAAWEDEAAGLGLLYSKHVGSADEVAAAVADPDAGWWDLPEELRYWYPDELALLTELSSALRDADDRPVYMYIPGHYTAEDIVPYVDALDLIGAGAYVEYAGQPHVWVRYRVESEIEAIEAAGYTTDERTPLGVVGVWNSEIYGYPGVPDRTEVVHDHLAALAAGARGLYTFSWWHAVVDPDVGDSADGVLEIARRVSGAEALGEWILRGEDLGELAVGSGEAELLVTPYGYSEALSYPAVWARAWRHAGAWTIVVVNSSESAVSATLSGLPGSRAERVYDGLVETATDGALALSLDRLEARVYRVVETR